MIRKSIKAQKVGLDPDFKYRGLETNRVEALSDAAFALAITLLVLSSTVPETFQELRESIRMIVPFAISIALIMVIWYQHYLFFIKFGLQDKLTVVINTFLLFLILVYVYPLKFLAIYLFELYASFFVGRENTLIESFGDMTAENVQFLMMMYGLGAFLIFFLISVFYHYALFRKDDLELNNYEVFSARSGRTANLLLALVPLLSFLFVWISPFKTPLNFALGGFMYMLYPIIMPIFGVLNDRASKKYIE